MSAFIRSLLVLVFMLAHRAPATAADEVDLLLVLAADVSRSVDTSEFWLQREAYAAALTNPRVIQAIQSGPHGRVAICFVEWSGAKSQNLLIDWTLVSDPDTAGVVSKQLLTLPRSFADRTSISKALAFSMVQLARAPFRAERRTIDVAGDGTNNAGSDLALVREEVLAQEITINGLVILSKVALRGNPQHTHPAGGLDEYYRRHVIGGPGSFLVVVDSHEAFARAILKKMTAEIAQHTRGGPARTATAIHRADGVGHCCDN